MTTECYYKNCKNHCYTLNTDGGPFCDKEECTATEEEVVIFEKERQEYLNSLPKYSNELAEMVYAAENTNEQR